MNEVLAAHVAPVHVFPPVAVGVVLVEQVVITLEEERAVGIIAPEGGRKNVVDGPRWIRLRPGGRTLNAGVGPGERVVRVSDHLPRPWSPCRWPSGRPCRRAAG